MPHISRGVEYGLHCMLYLSQSGGGTAPSAQELAEFQGISRAFVAKLFTRLEKAGLVHSAQGARGGYSLTRSPAEISVLDVVDAIDGRKRLFQCTEIRRRCAIFADSPPPQATRGLCGIHRVMLEAEEAMRGSLAAQTLADIGESVARTIPVRFLDQGREWFGAKGAQRTRKAGRRKRSGADSGAKKGANNDA